MSQIQGNFAPALIQALILCVVRFFTIPWGIWKGALLRLAAARNMDEEAKNVEESSEFPVFNWFRMAWDGIIFLSWPVMIIIGLLGLLGGIFSGYVSIAMGSFVMLMIYSYFAVILLSLFKESFILMLTIAANVEKINAKTASQKRTPE